MPKKYFSIENNCAKIDVKRAKKRKIHMKSKITIIQQQENLLLTWVHVHILRQKFVYFGKQ